MPSRLRISPPDDYLLRRDYCSYGYFLLSPNRWYPAAAILERPFDLAAGPALVRVAQPADKSGAELRVATDRTLSRAESADLRAQITRMLRLDEPADAIARFHALDPRWKRSGRGRLSRSPTFFEDVIKTVTSCNVTWPGTVTMNRRLCEVVGRGGAFPAAAKLARTRAASLRARCRVGYRDARLIELAKLFAPGGGNRRPGSRGEWGGGGAQEWFEDHSRPDEEVHEALLGLPGVGPYAAANLMQLLGRYSRLPLDTESFRHAKSVLGYVGDERQLRRRLHDHYAPFGEHKFRSYWFELWDFYEGRNGPAWTWERDTTGMEFTASKLAKPAVRPATGTPQPPRPPRRPLRRAPPPPPRTSERPRSA